MTKNAWRSPGTRQIGSPSRTRLFRRGSLVLAVSLLPLLLFVPVLFRPSLLRAALSGATLWRGLDGVANESFRAGGATVPDALGRGTWIVDEERDEVALVGPHGDVRRFAVGAWPAELVSRRDGVTFVSCRGSGEIVRIERDGRLRRRALAGEPRALALDEATGRLYAGLVTGRSLVALDAGTLHVVGRRPLSAEPRALALTPRGVAVLPAQGGEVVFVTTDLASERRVPLRRLGGRRAWHGQALVAQGDDLVVVHGSVDTGLDQAPLPGSGYGGGVSQPVRMLVAVLHGGRPTAFGPGLGLNHRLPVADVTGATLARGRLHVASRGTKKLLACTLSVAGVWCTPLAEGTGLLGVASAADGTVSAHAAFDSMLVAVGGEAVETAVKQGTPPPHSARRDRYLWSEPLRPGLALGRRLFHDARDRRIAAGGLACATCHPDGREDGLVWRLQGTRRQTPMLADRLAETAPYDWHGQSECLEDNVRQTIARLGGTGLEDDEVAGLVHYLLEGLRKPAPPSPPDPHLVAQGERVFLDPAVGCASCHVPELAFAGAAPQDVGSVSAEELKQMRSADPPAGLRPYDVPSLRHVGLTAPYFHDGSAASLEELVTGNRDRMGQTSWLGDADRTALVAYLRSL